ncbi:outer membrane protein OmpK, partial [Escherichia coli]|uniref:outer membrane protein OmpK n=1 Tax=Escherichia coli TaxID=562 RepID=UPI003F51A55F
MKIETLSQPRRISPLIRTFPSRTTEKSSTKSHKDDFGYLELEGGANFSWGEMYGFFDWENF